MGGILILVLGITHFLTRWAGQGPGQPYNTSGLLAQQILIENFLVNIYYSVLKSLALLTPEIKYSSYPNG
jgi:hypothetical protein